MRLTGDMYGARSAIAIAVSMIHMGPSNTAVPYSPFLASPESPQTGSSCVFVMAWSD